MRARRILRFEHAAKNEQHGHLMLSISRRRRNVRFRVEIKFQRLTVEIKFQRVLVTHACYPKNLLLIVVDLLKRASITQVFEVNQRFHHLLIILPFFLSTASSTTSISSCQYDQVKR